MACCDALSLTITRSLALDLLRAAARGAAGSAALQRCLTEAPPEQAMYLVLLHHHRGHGNLRVSLTVRIALPLDALASLRCCP